METEKIKDISLISVYDVLSIWPPTVFTVRLRNTQVGDC